MKLFLSNTFIKYVRTKNIPFIRKKNENLLDTMLLWLVTSGFVFQRVDIFGSCTPCRRCQKKGVVKGEESNLYVLT